MVQLGVCMIDAFRGIALRRGPGAAPLPVQLAAEVRRMVADGVLQPGDAVPSSRAVADGLGLSRGTVTAAYDQLTAEGYLVARDRSATLINPALTTTNAPAPPAAPVAPDRPRAALDFRPGHETTGPLTDATWRAAWRAAVRQEPTLDPMGEPALRDAVANHLRLARAMAVPPASITVTPGARAGLALLLSVAGPGARVAVESPGFPGLRRVLTQVGANVVPIDLTAASLAQAHTAAPLDMVLVTPNHQFPDGGSLPAIARQHLIGWARKHRVLVVEDDYDSEYRHLGPPLPPLWTLGPDVVAHLGTFSAVLGRSVATGYVVAPNAWRSGVAEARSALGAVVSPLAQLALAGYLRRAACVGG